MFHTLLVPLDGSESSEQSLPLARGIAAAASATVHLVQVHAPTVPGTLLSSTQFEYQGLDMEAYAERHREEMGEHLAPIAETFEAQGVTARPAVLEGRVIDVLTEHATSIEADLIVMTTHGRSGASRMWLGSVADGLVRHTHIPIVLLRANDEGRAPIEVHDIRHILVPLDGSDLGESVLTPAADLARISGARITLAHVVASHSALGTGVVPLLPDDIVRIRDQADDYLQEVAQRLRSEDLSVETHLTEGEGAASAIAAMADELEADLIAVATHGHGGVRRAVIGSVADKVLRSSSRPLMMLRPAADG
jgi:nucleotide-binding universal stress UspA family protein